jgi:RNA polymerase sigma-70 factor (ECF subfamily)
MTASRQPNIRSITTPIASTTGVTRVGSKLHSCYEDMLYKPASPQIENNLRQVSLGSTRCIACSAETALTASLESRTGATKMSASSFTADEICAVIPNLRAFAMSLCGNRDYADDLVQDTLMRAWGKMDRFQAGTNLHAWLFTILRHVFYSDCRKRRREVEDADGSYASRLTTIPGQEAHLDLEDFQRALMKLSADQREALLLVGAEGLHMRRPQRFVAVFLAP